MPTYLYCLLTPAGGPGPAATLRGIGGAAVRALRTDSLEAWVSTVPAPTPAPTAEAAREHDVVVSAALGTGRTPLPARFGQVWPSDDACLAAVEARADELRPLLARVAGLVEMTVYTLLPGMPPALRAPMPPPAEGRPGRAYLQRLRARADRERHLRAALDALRARVTQALGSLSRGEVAEIRGGESALALSVSYLVPRDAEATFRRVIEEVARESAARLVVAGPRAPYSFAPAGRPVRRIRESRASDRS